MRLAVFTNMYPARVTTFFERDLRALISSGVEVDVFAIHPLDPSQWQYTLRLLGPEVLPRERVHHLSQAAAWASARPWPPARARRFVGDAVQILAAAARFGPVPLAKTAYVLPQAWAWAEAFQDRFDHVLAYWGNYAGTCAYLFHRLATPGIPFSIWLHAGADLYFRPVFLARKVAYADRIITCCAFNRGYLARAFPTMADSLTRKVHVCYHGLDLNTLRFNPDHRLPNRLVAVGRLAQDKGFDNLLRAMRALADRGTVTQLDLVGAGPEERPLGALARRLDLAAHVRFRGWLPFAEVQTAMQNATVLVHPSTGLGDGLPNVIREAMALGTPVIASDVAGIPEALDDGRCGVLVPPRDVGALAGAIGQLLDDPVRRRSLASRARTRTEDQFDMWRNGARLAEVLRSTPGRDTRGEPAMSPARAVWQT